MLVYILLFRIMLAEFQGTLSSEHSSLLDQILKAIICTCDTLDVEWWWYVGYSVGQSERGSSSEVYWEETTDKQLDGEPVHWDPTDEGTWSWVHCQTHRLWSELMLHVWCTLCHIDCVEWLHVCEYVSGIYCNVILLQWDSNYIYLIMEYCSGGDLSDFIKTRKVLTEVKVRYFLQQLGE